MVKQIINIIRYTIWYILAFEERQSKYWSKGKHNGCLTPHPWKFWQLVSQIGGNDLLAWDRPMQRPILTVVGHCNYFWAVWNLTTTKQRPNIWASQNLAWLTETRHAQYVYSHPSKKPFQFYPMSNIFMFDQIYRKKFNIAIENR